MRRMMMMLAASVALVVWPGCQAEREEPEDADPIEQNGDGDTQPNDNGNTGGGVTPEQGVAELSRFESEQELEDYFKGQVLDQNSRFGGLGFEDDFDFAAEGGAEGEGEGEGEGEAVQAPEDSAAPELGADLDGIGQADEGAGNDRDSFSDTTIQEEGVDEADVVKTDGEYIYVMTGQELRIVKATPPAEMALLSTFGLEGYGTDLYLVGDLAVALTQSSGVFYPIGIDIAVAEPGADVLAVEEPFIEPGFSARPQSIVTIVDVSDRRAPVQVSQTAFDGHIASSRMIGGVLRLVLSNLPDYYFDILPLGVSEEELALADIDLDALLPDFQTTNQAGDVTRGNIVEWDGFFRPSDPGGFGVTTVVTLDTAAPESFDAVAVLANPGLIYASTEALYITDTDWYFDFRRTETDIYKFAFQEDTVALVAAGTVPGRILNQYSMGEYDGYLRVATTTDRLFDWETGDEFPSSNAVYVLGEQEGKLATVGSIEDLGITETIQSARFVGPRGYVVTFRQIDPLFTLDLSNPFDPKVVGELKVAGFSTFIVPMDADHLLTIGVYVPPEGPTWPQGLQLSVFDVSNFAQPQLMHHTIIGDDSTYSEATWNPKAFTYFAEQDLLAFPVEHWAWGGFDDVIFAGDEELVAAVRQDSAGPLVQGEEFRGLLVYGVAVGDGFDYQGRVSTQPEDEGYWGSSFTRGVFIGDHVYAVTDRLLAAGEVANLETVTATVTLETFEDFPIPDLPDRPVDVEPELGERL